MMQELSQKKTLYDKLAVSHKYANIAPKYELSPEKNNNSDDEELVRTIEV